MVRVKIKLKKNLKNFQPEFNWNRNRKSEVPPEVNLKFNRKPETGNRKSSGSHTLDVTQSYNKQTKKSNKEIKLRN